jgi:hypothetical protein
MVFFGRSSLERALAQYVAHYHEERNRQGLQNRLLKRSDGIINRVGRVKRLTTEFSDTTAPHWPDDGRCSSLSLALPGEARTSATSQIPDLFVPVRLNR